MTALTNRSDVMMTRLLPAYADLTLSESAISMVPAIVAETSDPVTVVTRDSTAPRPQAPSPANEFIAFGDHAVEETDAVLEDWQELSWWDQSAAEENALPEPAALPVASATVMGAILSLVPKSLRRQTREDKKRS